MLFSDKYNLHYADNEKNLQFLYKMDEDMSDGLHGTSYLGIILIFTDHLIYILLLSLHLKLIEFLYLLAFNKLKMIYII